MTDFPTFWKTLTSKIPTLSLACVASVSSWVIARKLERERELPSPFPLIPSFFCSRPNFLDELARKRLLCRLPFHIPAETWKRCPYRAEPPRKGIIGIIPPRVTTQTREAKASARGKIVFHFFFSIPHSRKHERMSEWASTDQVHLGARWGRRTQRISNAL